MIKLHSRFWGALLLAVTLALSTVVPVFAALPTTTTYVLQGTQLLASCDGFQVFDDYDVTIVQTIFYDQDGNPIEIHLAINGTDTYRQSVTGQSITMPSHFMARIDVRAGLNSSSGLVYHLVVPGLGAVLLEVGRSVYDFNTGTFVFLAGPHQITSGGTADLCAAFS